MTPSPAAPSLLGLASLALLAALLAALPACKPKGELAICPASLASERTDENDPRVLPTWRWFQLVAPNVKLKLPEILPPDELRTCNGASVGITWPDPEHEALDPRANASALPPRPLTDADLTMVEAPDGYVLLWARLRHYDDGSALGPVALARRVERGVEIRGVGTLWMHAQRPRLRLETLGDDAQVLVADALRCPSAEARAAGDRCAREIHLLPLIKQRFMQADLVEDGALIGPARFLSFERIDTPERESVRRAEVLRVLRFKGGKATVAESIYAADCDLRTQTCDGESRSRDERELRWDPDAQRFTVHRGTWRRMTGR